ncbi:MAG: type IV toxin-antitoxin system AbiEi family antitoxin domain-containing protein [Treponema sp.]|nr:type IV toxin-antitoxin system AbiEi family antitoxin domain-containing protein [Treponema sp.]MCL2251224.1 type IV toxin-antitoxin system AbiEi family antitoxin domain-containing protein [Treponema sp.]
MVDQTIVEQLLSHGKGMFSAVQAVEAELNRQQLSDFVKSGVLERNLHEMQNMRQHYRMQLNKEQFILI